MIGGAAVQCHGENAGDGGFADPAMSAEYVAVRDALLLDGIFQGAGDMILSNHLREALRTVFARQNLVCHGKFDYKPSP
jgi:hypothetical protein